MTRPQRLAPLALPILVLLVFASPSPASEKDEQAAGWQADPELVKHWAKRRAGGLNFEESRVPDYQLPDPLRFEDGRPVKTAKDWTDHRRAEVLNLFREHVYGVRPKTDYKIEYKTVGQRDNAFGLGATARQVRATVRANGKSHAFEFVLVVPQIDKSDKPVPIVVLINNRKFFALNQAVGKADPFWPVEKLVRAGYATASFHTSHVDPDKKDGYADGIRALLDDPQSDPKTRWKSISAWGWGASRVLDYALADARIDPKRTAIAGHSRGGKTALWAGAEDPRFTLVYSNNSGCGGAALSRRAYGESVARINKNFPHWFCDTFKAYDDNEAKLPVDQHELIALIAPRAVYVASADEDLWADPRGEYTAIVKAGPVFALFDREHIKKTAVPPLDTPRHVGATGYHIRTGGHNLTEQDWDWFLAFAKTVFKP